jgi:hypothetical protein
MVRPTGDFVPIASGPAPKQDQLLQRHHFQTEEKEVMPKSALLEKQTLFTVDEGTFFSQVTCHNRTVRDGLGHMASDQRRPAGCAGLCRAQSTKPSLPGRFGTCLHKTERIRRLSPARSFPLSGMLETPRVRTRPAPPGPTGARTRPKRNEMPMTESRSPRPFWPDPGHTRTSTSRPPGAVGSPARHRGLPCRGVATASA